MKPRINENNKNKTILTSTLFEKYGKNEINNSIDAAVMKDPEIKYLVFIFDRILLIIILLVIIPNDCAINSQVILGS